MKDLNDMTHEELAAEARRVARKTGDEWLLADAAALQTAVDNEIESMPIANALVRHMEDIAR